MASQDYSAAERGFTAVLKKEPANVGAMGNLGVIFARTHRYGEAIAVYRKALKLAPGDKTLLTNLGLAYLKEERFADALPLFAGLAERGGNAQASELLASCYLSLGRYDQALTVLGPLRQLEPASPGVLYMAGVALTRLKRKDEAREALSELMRVASPAQANFLLGKASYETGDFERAVEFFRKTLSADAAFEGAHRELGKALISLRENDQAIAELRQAAPDDPEAIYFLGAALVDASPVEAAVLLKRARELTPDFWGPLYYLGRMELGAGRALAAIPLLEGAAKRKPEETAVHYELAKAYRQAGRAAEASAELVKVKELKSRALQKEVEALHPAGKP